LTPNILQALLATNEEARFEQKAAIDKNAKSNCQRPQVILENQFAKLFEFTIHVESIIVLFCCLSLLLLCSKSKYLHLLFLPLLLVCLYSRKQKCYGHKFCCKKMSRKMFKCNWTAVSTVK